MAMAVTPRRKGPAVSISGHPFPPPPITGDQHLVKSLNRMALLRLMRERPGLSRAELADLSGLTRSTVSLLVKELIHEGWLAEDAAVVSGALGRRPTPLRPDGRRLALLGAELTPDTIRVVSSSIHGEVQEVNQAALRDTSPEAACHQLVDMVTVLAARVALSGRSLLGIGVGLPGAVDPTSGVLHFAPNIGWRNVAVGQRLRVELDAAGLAAVPVYCQNEADVAAVGEAEFGPKPAADPLVYVTCGVGLGSGVVLGQGLFTGATGAGGEIGHTTLHLDGRPCSCGRLGCAEAYIGLRAIAADAGFLRANGEIDRVGLQQQMASRHPVARQAFERAGQYLGVLLHNVWVTFDPQVVVLGGEVVSLGGEPFIEAALARLHGDAGRAGLPPVPIRVSRFGDLATAIGGAAFALHAMLRPLAVQAIAPLGAAPAAAGPQN